MFVLGAMIVVGALQFPIRVRDVALPIAPVARLWFDADAQHRAALAPVPYDLLRAVDQNVARDARILLVTDGNDVRHREYTSFHRALYYLTPRAVTWLSPAPHDGTWEANWWTSAPLTRDAVMQVAQTSNADHILFVGQLPFAIEGELLGVWNDGTLWQLRNRAQEIPPIYLESRGIEGLGGVVLGLLIILSSGALVVKFIARAGFDFARGEAFALAWLLGAGFVSLWLWFALLAGASLQIAVLLCVIPAALGFVWSMRVFLRTPRARWHPPRPRWKWVAVVWIGMQTIYVGWIAMAQPLVYWDSWVNWAMKARTIFLMQTLSPARYADPTRAVTHLNYPLLFPLVEASLFQWLGAPDDRWVGIVSVMFFLALLAGVYYGVRRLARDDTRAWLALVAVTSMPTLTLMAGSGFADVPMAAYTTFAGVALVEWLERGERGALIVAMLCGACLPWLKNEGWILLGALLAAMLLCAPFHARTWRGILACGLAAILVAGTWYVFAALRASPSPTLLPMNFETLRANVGRVPSIALYFARELASPQFSFVFPLAALVFVARFWTRQRAPFLSPHALLLLAPLLYVLVMSGTYIFSAFTPYRAHLANSAYRLILQVVPLVVIWIAVQMSLPQRAAQQTA